MRIALSMIVGLLSAGALAWLVFVISEVSYRVFHYFHDVQDKLDRIIALLEKNDEDRG